MDYLGTQVVPGYGGNYGLRPAPDATDVSLSDLGVELPSSEAELMAIHRLVKRDWFDRLWVRQEIGLASPASVVACGTRVVPWYRVRAALSMMFVKRHRPFSGSRELEARIDHIRGVFFQPPVVHLDALRHFFGYALCRDPRDRVYAVLSMLPATDDGGVAGRGYPILRPCITSLREGLSTQVGDARAVGRFEQHLEIEPISQL